MSEINVSLIQDEDVLRRMWQQTEDFSKKKEIRTHMYRLREERLRNLYSPEPKAEAKGCEFTSSATHVASFADQNFQSMKSKEVRDAGSPPKEFTYRGQDLKEYSNAGWNVESEDSKQDGGATRVKALHATVEGRYDVEGGAGRFSAADTQRRARTELHDDHSRLVRDETSSSTAARDHLVRTAPDGTHVTSSTSSSTTSNVKQVSETRTEPVPYVTEPHRDTVQDTNTDQRITNRNETRRTDIDSGDLVSRKVEYPDDNTKVIVETRCLPDGTRVTSTRREFRVPAQQTSYHSRNETRSNSNQHRAHSDTRQSSSTTTHRTLNERSTSADIVDTQRNRDDTDFRRQIREHTSTDDDDRSAIQRTIERREFKTDRNVSDSSQTDNYSQTRYTTRTNNEVFDRSASNRNEYTRINQGENERISNDVDETGHRREVVNTTRDDRIPKKDVEDIQYKKNTEERVQNITKDSKVEKVVERNTTSDRYQTTYQTDYHQRKVSEDLSPTHQAWASTLRSDTPSTTHPSTRASSPGSKTFQSSTSSLRSSVSPDKHRKPSSRGGSPNKIDRFSPTRTVTSDIYSDTHSTYSVTETKTNKYTSPERKPPTGQRTSTSPAKRPQTFSPSQSPERKSTEFTPDHYRSSPTRSPTRPRQSPEKPIQSKNPRVSSPSRTYTPDNAKYPEASPEREVGYRKSPGKESHNHDKRPSTSPDRKPGYMRPTAASQPTSETRRPSRPRDEPDRSYPSKYAPTSSPDRKKTTKVVEDHYRFVDEETKVNIRNQNISINEMYKPSPYDSIPRQKSPSPKRQTPKDSESSPATKGRMPQKDKISVTENDELYGRIDKSVEIFDTKETNDTKTSKSITKESSGDRNVPQRDPSPSKYDTYDKKKPRETIITKIATDSIEDSVKHDALIYHEKVKINPEPLSPTKKGPRDITSPTKSPTKDVRYKNTTDFISTERNTEEINKRTESKHRPRQLTTPSSSPTRKPKEAEPEPSTGQSSPTTSVSGFVYFGSPCIEKPLITDLDDESDNVDEPTYDRPDTLDVKSLPTPSKIPCRSPSPEQRPSQPKDGLPRKSSLKKPSAPPAEPSLASPKEKPPTNFRVSPTEDKPNASEHKVFKKDQPEGSPVKPKPPLQRRETYEDRCRKILGMIEDTTSETVTKETKNYIKRTESGQSSQSVSPCDSPSPKEISSFPKFSTTTTKVTDKKTDVTEFISREIDENINTTKTSKKKTPSRESSPAKLQDIISRATSVIEHETESIDQKTVNGKKTIIHLTRKTPSKDVPRQSNTSPEKNTKQSPTPATRGTSPTKPIPAERTSVSPTRKPSRDSPVEKTKPENHPKDSSPTRRTPGEKLVYSTTTSTVTSDTVEDTINVKSTNKSRSRILESPNRDIPATKPRDDSPKYQANDKPRKSPENSPSRTINRKVSSTKSPQIQPPTTSSPTRTPMKPESSPERKPSYQTREPQMSNTKSSSPSRLNQQLPGNIKATTTSFTKHDAITNEKNIQETITSTRTERKHSSLSPAVSPTRKQSEPRNPSPTKNTRPTNLNKKLETSPERKPSQQQPSSPIKSTDKHPTTKSPSRPNLEKEPGYIKTTTSTSSKFETTSVTNVHDIFSSLTDKKYTTTRHAGSSRSSPDHGTHDYCARSPTKPAIINERPSNESVSSDHKPKDSTTKVPGYMKPTEATIHKFESTITTDIEDTTIDRSDSPSHDGSVSPDSVSIIPGYMRPTEATIHKYDSNVVTDLQGTITSKTVHRKSPEPTDRSDSPCNRRSPSPDPKPKETVSKTPGYMRPTEAVIHKYDSNVVTDLLETITSRTMRRESPVPTDRSDSPSNRRSPSPEHKPKETVSKTPGYMRPTEAVIYKYDSNVVTDLQETITSRTVRRESPVPTDRSDSPSNRRSPSPEHKPKETVSKTPGYMRPTEAVIHKFDSNVVTDLQETITSRTMRMESPEPTDISDSPSNRRSWSPDHKPKETVSETPSYMRPTESVSHKYDSTTVTDVEETVNSRTMRRKSPDRSDSPSSRRCVSPDYKPKDSIPKTPGYMRPTESVIHKFDSTVVTDVEEIFTAKDIQRQSLESVDRSYNSDLKTKDAGLKTPGYMRPTEAVTHKYDTTMVTEVEQTEHRTLPDPYRKLSPERIIERTSQVKPSPTKPGDSYPTDSPSRSVVSPDRKPSQKKPIASAISKFESGTTTENLDYLNKPEETRQLRTPSPMKKTTIQVSDVSTELILSEKEQEIFDKVQKSLRKLSPDRKQKSPSPPSRERTPNKSTLSLEDLDNITISDAEHTHKFTGEKISEVIEEHVTTKTKITRPYKPTDKSKDQMTQNKPTSRNTSPTKKTPPIPAKSEKSPDSPTKSRSISPKKPFAQSERPHSPKVSKVSGIKQREPLHSVLTRKPTPATIKIEKLPSDIKRANGVTKQTVTVKTSTTSKITSRPLSSPSAKFLETEPKRTPMPKGIKEPSTNTKKETVTRTTSDNSIKLKKTSPQRMRSKPEIQISDMSPKSPKSHKPSKLPTKPKSATALNTSLEEEDFIVDLQQSKSSRENSPDRICPTPVNFHEDVGTPRFPDEVSEPDDEYRRRTYHTIHETESVVDDIVEICEDEELFIKKADSNITTEEDDSGLSVTDKVTKFTNKIESIKKPKTTFSTSKDTERKIHSDLITENLKSDECLLSVSEKVNKFGKGPGDLKDNRSPTKRIDDEYDKDTIYQDDYTKLSVNDKAHLFVETAENIKVSKPKLAQKVERPDLSNVDESLKSDECLLSVSDKVNKFVKTAEQFMTETTEVGEKEKKIKEQHERIMKQFVDDEEDEIHIVTSIVNTAKAGMVTNKLHDQKPKILPSKVKDFGTQRTKSSERTPTAKITTLRSSEAVKKAKALFENIASTQTKEATATKTTKLTDIGVINKSSKTDSTTVLHPSVEDISPNVTDGETEIIAQTPSHKERPLSDITTKPHLEDKPQNRLNHLKTPDVPRSKSPLRQSIEVSSSRTVSSSHQRYPATRAESPNYRPESPKTRSESDKQVPGYLKPTKTSQLKEETKVTEESEVSTRRGSGKFGVELRRTSVERSTVSSERRRSVDHHQPCIEDIYDLDLLEQMLEKVMGYEQRRRIRAQIRIVKKESEHVESTYTLAKKVNQMTHVQTSTPRPRSPERQQARSPERIYKSTSQKTASPDRLKSTPHRVAPERNQTKTTLYLNGHSKEPVKNITVTRQTSASPEKSAPKSIAKSSVRQPSPEKNRTVSPSKTNPKQKPNRFNEYASAYMKKIQVNETDKVKLTDTKTKKVKDIKQTVKYENPDNVQESTTTKSFSERALSKDIKEVVQVSGKRSSSPEKRLSPVRKHQSPERKVPSPERKTSERKEPSPERLYQRTPSPDFKRPRADAAENTVIKTINDIDKKIPKAPVRDEKPSWVTNRNLKKITSETRTFSSKKIETEKPKYRAASPSKVIVKPTDVITSSYGPGPLDADGKPLFGIKALRNGATNFQVKGTVIRQEYHSRNGGEPEGTVSVTAYSSQPEDLQQLLADQSVEPPSRLHGLSAITTTKKFGGDTGNTYSNVHTKEERTTLDQFTHTDRKIINNNQIEDVSFDNVDSDERRIHTSENRREEKEVKRGQKMERREDKKNVRQSSVKSLTEKFIKSTNDTGKVDRSSYPKAGLILRTTTLRDSVSSDDVPGLHRADSEHSLNDETFEHVESKRTTRTTRTEGSQPGRTTRTTVTDATQPGRTRTTVTETSGQPGRTTRTVRTTTVVQEPVVTSVSRTERSFLDSNTKVTGVQDILTRMKNADIVIQEGDSSEDQEARALLNKFLGATVLMSGMQGYVNEESSGKINIQEASVRSSSSTRIEEIDLDHCWDEQLLRKLLDECTDYEQRRRLRARIRSLMAEQEACANAVTEALGCATAEVTRGDADGAGGEADLREEEEVTVSSSVRRDSTEKTVSSSTTTKTSKVLESMTRQAPKPVSPFAKFRQLEKQNSTTNPNSPKTPQSPGSPSQPYFKFTDPALQCSALTIKERLLQWCRDKTRDYENVKLENFSTSWADGLAFCALVHHFLPDAFDYSKLTADKRRHNFTLAFKVADEKAGIYPLLDVDDMVAMRKPDWKCVFTYVQSIYRRFKDER